MPPSSFVLAAFAPLPALARLSPHCCFVCSWPSVNLPLLPLETQPNYGDFTTEGLAARLKSNADAGIFTTIIGQFEPAPTGWEAGTAVCCSACGHSGVISAFDKGTLQSVRAPVLL